LDIQDPLYFCVIPLVLFPRGALFMSGLDSVANAGSSAQIPTVSEILFFSSPLLPSLPTFRGVFCFGIFASDGCSLRFPALVVLPTPFLPSVLCFQYAGSFPFQSLSIPTLAFSSPFVFHNLLSRAVSHLLFSGLSSADPFLM